MLAGSRQPGLPCREQWREGADVQLFVSYARVDKDIADALVADGHALGHHVFYDRDLSGGQRWWDTLLDQIQGSEVFLPVLSDDYRTSQACQAEASWAAALGVPFVPMVTVEQSPGLYDPVIAEANWISYDPALRGSLADLARGLAAAPPVTSPAVAPSRPEIPLTYLNAIDRQLRDAPEIGRGEQLTLISDLRSKLGSRDDHNARELLATLRARPEITFEAATTIDGLLAAPGPLSPADPTPTQPVRRPAQPSVPEPAPARSTPPAPAPPQPATRPSPQQPTTAQRSWLRLVVTGAAGLVAVAAAAVAPWGTVDRPFGTRSFGLLEEGGGIPEPLGLVALAGVLACIALALVVQLVRTPTVFRALVTTVILLTALVAVVGAFVVANDPIDSMSWGPVLLAAALLVLAVLTGVPALNAGGRRTA